MTDGVRQNLAVVSILGAGLGAIGIFGNFCPSLTDCQNSGHDPRFVGSLRRAYTASWALALGLGGLVSIVDESPLPLLTVAGAGAVMTYVYEQELPEQNRMTSPLELFKTNGPLAIDRNWGV